MSDITYNQVEDLLRAYPILNALVASLQVELQASMATTVMNNADDIIYGLAIGSRKLDGMPHPPEGYVSDKTGRVATAYRKAINNERLETVKDVANDIMTLNTILEKIDIALSALNYVQRDVIRLFYFHKRSWSEITSKVRVSRQYGNKEKREGIRIMMKILRISEDMYLMAMEKSGGGDIDEESTNGGGDEAGGDQDGPGNKGTE